MQQYCGQPEAIDYFNWSVGPQAPLQSVVCPYVQGGVGMPLTVFSMFFFGVIGLALAVRVRHPSPLIVAAILTTSVATLSMSGQAVNILAIVVFMAISGLGLYLYHRANTAI